MKISAALLKKYLDGQCTSEEEDIVHGWYQSFEQNENPLIAFSDQQKEQLRAKILHHIRDNISGARNDNSPKSYSRKVIYLLSAVAVAAAIIMMILLFPVKQANMSSPVPAIAQLTVVNNTPAMKKEVLPDSSIVWLNANSELRFPKQFSGTYRTVKMQGEAFFEVTKDHAHPFIIYSGGVLVKVWGTTFKIKAYKNIPTEVAVVTGKVSVSIPDKKQSELMLLPNEKVTYLEKEQQLQKHELHHINTMQMWQKASLSFDNVKVKKVIEVLNKKFEVHIVVNDEKINQYALKADFTNQNLPDILEMLSASLDINYQINDHEIIIGSTERAVNKPE